MSVRIPRLAFGFAGRAGGPPLHSMFLPTPMDRVMLGDQNHVNAEPLVKPSTGKYNRSFAYAGCAPWFNHCEYRAGQGQDYGRYGHCTTRSRKWHARAHAAVPERIVALRRAR